MRLLLRKIKSFQGLSPRQRKFVIWVFGLSINRYLLRFFGSDKAFTEKLKVDFDKAANPTEEQMAIAFDIAKAIRIADQYIPWPNVCRHQAWQAIYLLRFYKIPFDFKVGIKKGENSKDEGHAWVTSGEYFVSGDCAISQYNLIDFLGKQKLDCLKV